MSPEKRFDFGNKSLPSYIGMPHSNGTCWIILSLEGILWWQHPLVHFMHFAICWPWRLVVSIATCDVDVACFCFSSCFANSDAILSSKRIFGDVAGYKKSVSTHRFSHWLAEILKLHFSTMARLSLKVSNVIILRWNHILITQSRFLYRWSLSCLSFCWSLQLRMTSRKWWKESSAKRASSARSSRVSSRAPLLVPSTATALTITVKQMILFFNNFIEKVRWRLCFDMI